jgi:hypothetical protein
MYNYSDELYSDYHKDAYGNRPGVYGMKRWNSMTPDQKQQEWDRLGVAFADSQEQERLEKERALTNFHNSIQDIMEAGADDYETAIRWMTDGEVFHNSQCIDQWVWELGLLFTDTGKEIIKILNNQMGWKYFHHY